MPPSTPSAPNPPPAAAASTALQPLPPLTSRPLYQVAPRDPDAGVDISNKLLRMGNIAKRVSLWSPTERESFLQKVKETVASSLMRYSSLSVKKRSQLTALRWECFVCQVLYELGEITEPVTKEAVWLSSTLKEHAHYYLMFCVSIVSHHRRTSFTHHHNSQVETFRTHNGSYVTARTLYSWFHSFVSVINTHCADPHDKQLAGPTLLLQGGLHNALASQVEESTSAHVLLYRFFANSLTVVIRYGLRRELKPFVMLGITELQMMIEEVLKNTTSSNRPMGIMRIIEFLLCFFTAARPSSISSANSQTTAEKKASENC